MRRKTTAKRILDLEHEEEAEEEEPSYEDFDVTTAHRQTLCAPEQGSPEEDPVHDGGVISEGLLGLQSRSKAELVAMVLSMQREMDSLREQIRCLTACGRLARNLEALIQRTDAWSTTVHTRTPSPSMPPEALAPPAMLAPPPPPGGLTTNGHWARPHPAAFQNGQQQQQRPRETQEEGGGAGLHRPPLYQEFITVELLERCNTGTTAQKLTNDLLRGLYERDRLASHSISGVVNNKRGPPKPALPADQIQAILRAVQHYFPGKTDSEIKGYIRQKLQNEAKRLRKKPHLAVKAEPGTEGAESTAYT